MNIRIFVVIALANGGCGSDSGGGPAVDATGSYSGQVTNGANSCPGVWDTGQSSNAMATVAQSGTSVSIQVQGAAGLLLVAGFGTNSFSGTVSGSHIDATIIGSITATRGGCMYTSNGNLVGDLNGDTLTGAITYIPQTNGHADCTTMAVTGCSSLQTFVLNRSARSP
jgi:hypothetical protein